MTALLERLLAWLNRRSGCFELTDPVAVQDGASWLRIAPDEPLRWFSTNDEALRYRARGNAGRS